jgi:hypothetical protein
MGRNWAIIGRICVIECPENRASLPYQNKARYARVAVVG